MEKIRKDSAKKYEYNGESKSLYEWADEFGFNASTIYGRLNRGYSVKKAFETPIQPDRRRRK